MNKLYIAALASVCGSVLFLSNPAHAESFGRDADSGMNKPPEHSRGFYRGDEERERPNRTLEFLTEQLSLTSEQQKQAKSITDNFRQIMRSSMEAERREFESILTAEQKEKLKKHSPGGPDMNGGFENRRGPGGPDMNGGFENRRGPGRPGMNRGFEGRRGPGGPGMGSREKDIEGLNLTLDQKEKMNKISASHKAEHTEAINRLKMQLSPILTSEQRAKLNTLNFEGPEMRGPGGPDGHRGPGGRGHIR